ncbi:MAG: 50S ribosomal protein L35 [Planctomycetota bacterium]
MPKLKTKKSVSKRMRLSKHGKVLRSRAFRSHLMKSKNAKRRRRLRSPAVVEGAQAKTMRVLIAPHA